jgi:hypothetical protein
MGRAQRNPSIDGGMDTMGFGYRLYPSYNGYNSVGGTSIDTMIDQLISKHDELPALSTEKRLLFFRCSIGGAAGTIAHRHPRVSYRFQRGQGHAPFTMEAVVILPTHLSSGGTNGHRKHNPRLVELAALAEDALGNKTLAQASNRLGER